MLLLLSSILVAATGGSVADLVASQPADSLPQMLVEQSDDPETWMLLGQLHFARGEYRDAGRAFARAGAQLDLARRPRARYLAGLSWMALREFERARAALQEAAVENSPVRAGARLALAQSWEASGRADRAFEELRFLMTEGPGEWGASALAMQRELALHMRRDAAARRAGERLLRDYPTSMEATRMRQIIEMPVSALGTVVLRLGAFADETRARSLAADVRRAGFAEVRVIPPSGVGAPLYVVQLGPYADPEEAEAQADRAE